MKKLTFALLLLISSATLMAQSNSYQILKNKFKGEPDVHSFSVSGWVGRLVLNLAGEYEFREAIKELDHIRLMTIPKSAFISQDVTVNGFKRILKQNTYEELAFIRDDGEEVTIYLQEGKHNNNRYFVLIDEQDEVVAIEMKGYIDPQLLNPKTTTLASNK